MLANFTQTTAGKATIIVIAILAVGAAVFEAVRMATGTGEQFADDKAVQQSAQKQVDTIKNQNLPPALKAEMMSHYQGLAQGGSGKPQTGKQPGR